jgi:Spy/CpxP family protein refolding chaperone
MMRFFLLAGLSLSICLSTSAQNTDSTPPVRPKAPPAQQAAKQLKNLEHKLRLNQDQVLQLQVILINRDAAIDSSRKNPSGDRRSGARNRRSINQQADQQIDALLTPDQKTLYQQWKQGQRQKAALRRKNAGSIPQ